MRYDESTQEVTMSAQEFAVVAYLVHAAHGGIVLAQDPAGPDTAETQRRVLGAARTAHNHAHVDGGPCVPGKCALVDTIDATLSLLTGSVAPHQERLGNWMHNPGETV